jgi:hypothetical protein
MPFCVLAVGCSPRAEILELARRVQVPRYDFARGLLQSDLFKSCSTGHEAGISAALGNSGNDCLAIGPDLAYTKHPRDIESQLAGSCFTER